MQNAVRSFVPFHRLRRARCSQSHIPRSEFIWKQSVTFSWKCQSEREVIKEVVSVILELWFDPQRTEALGVGLHMFIIRGRKEQDCAHQVIK